MPLVDKQDHGFCPVLCEPSLTLWQGWCWIPQKHHSCEQHHKVGVGTTPKQLPVTVSHVRNSEFSRINLQGGGVGLQPGGWVSGSGPPPSLIFPRVSWVGLLANLLSLFTEALSSCVWLLLFALFLCRHCAQTCLWLGAFVSSSHGAKREHLKSEKHKQWEKAKKSVRTLTFLW